MARASFAKEREKMKNLDQLFKEAKVGKLTGDEIAYVAQKISVTEAGKNDETLYTLIHILGKAGATQYRKLIERFLFYPSSPIISRIALKVLCDYWGETKNYLEPLKAFVKGVQWDKEMDVQLVAISSAGEYLREHSDKILLKLLIAHFENNIEAQPDTYESLLFETSFQALARAMGVDWQNLFGNDTPLSDDFVFSVISQAYNKLQNE